MLRDFLLREISVELFSRTLVIKYDVEYEFGYSYVHPPIGELTSSRIVCPKIAISPQF